jgi:hypothetical protein
MGCLYDRRAKGYPPTVVVDETPKIPDAAPPIGNVAQVVFAQVLYAGPAPLEIAGLFQVNLVVPSFATSAYNTNAANGVTYVQVTVSPQGGGPNWVSQIALLGVAP